MKRILFLLLAASVLFSCESEKKVHAGDFTMTVPKGYVLHNLEDNYPENVLFDIIGKEGQSGVYNVEYFSDEDMQNIQELYAENDGIQGFLYNKLMQKFNHVDESEYATIEGAGEVEWTDDKMCCYVNFWGDSDDGPWKGAVLNYLVDNTLVSSIIMAPNDDDVSTLMIAAVLEFD